MNPGSVRIPLDFPKSAIVGMCPTFVVFLGFDGSVLDIVWYDLGVRYTAGLATYPRNCDRATCKAQGKERV